MAKDKKPAASKKKAANKPLETTDELTEKALAEAAGKEPTAPEAEAKPVRIKPGMRDESLITFTTLGGQKRTMKRYQYDAMEAERKSPTPKDDSENFDPDHEGPTDHQEPEEDADAKS